MSHAYYEPIEIPVARARLSVFWQRPPYQRPWNDGTIVEYDKGGRTVVAVEGESELVERVWAAMQGVIEEIRQEIDSGGDPE